MAILKKKIMDVTLDDNPTSSSASYDFNGLTAKRISLYVKITKTNAPTNVVIDVDVSPDVGVTLVDYDKLLLDDGNDAPQASETYTASGTDIITLSPEDVVEHITVNAVGTGTTSSATFRVEVWLVAAY